MAYKYYFVHFNNVLNKYVLFLNAQIISFATVKYFNFCLSYHNDTTCLINSFLDMKLLGKFSKLSCEKTKFQKSWWGTLLKFSDSHSIFRSLLFNVCSRLPWLHNTYGFVNSQRQGIVHALVELMHNFCHLFGRPFTQKSVKPLFQSRLTISEEEKSMHILVTLFQCDN